MVVALNRALADAAPLDEQIRLRTQQAATTDERLRNLEEGAKALDDAQRERRTLEELVRTYRAPLRGGAHGRRPRPREGRQRQRRSSGRRPGPGRPGRDTCPTARPAS